jgi:glutaminyl-peptide cyclotransferase
MKKIIPFIFILLMVACNNGANDKPDDVPKDVPINLSYSIISPSYPHDTSSFTQGLTFYKDELYEGTGNYEKSRLMKVDLKTGKAIKSVKLDVKSIKVNNDSVFGEGIAILHDTIYQLTWQTHVVLVYNMKLEKIKEFPLATEGWGITTDGKSLIVSAGGSDLDYYDPSTFAKQKSVTVTEAGANSFNLNELEFIDGFVYANQWQAPYIFKINPADGKIVAKINLTQVWDRVMVIDPKANVPNGIAYNDVTKKIYVTGKLWPELYEIEFGK